MFAGNLKGRLTGRLRYKTVTVKIKYFYFKQTIRSKIADLPFAICNDTLEAAAGLLATVYPFKRPVRLLGVRHSIRTSSRGHDPDADKTHLTKSNS